MNEKEQAFLIEYEKLCRKHKLCIYEHCHDLVIEEVADDELLVLNVHKDSKNEGLLSGMSLRAIWFAEPMWMHDGDWYIKDGKIIKYEKKEKT